MTQPTSPADSTENPAPDSAPVTSPVENDGGPSDDNLGSGSPDDDSTESEPNSAAPTAAETGVAQPVTESQAGILTDHVQKIVDEAVKATGNGGEVDHIQDVVNDAVDKAQTAVHDRLDKFEAWLKEIEAKVK